jgi:hypothetical protein
MRIRGKRLAWFGLPLGAAVLVAVALALPRPVREATAVGSPTLAGAALAGTALADPTAGSTASTAGDGSPAGSGVAPGSTAPGGSAEPPPQASPSASPTTGPAAAPSTSRPTSRPTAAPTAAATLPPPPPPPPTAAPTAAGPIPPLSACSILPSTNVWNKRVDGLPVATNSATMIAAIGLSASLHPDFSDAGGYGIPFNVVGASTPRSTVSFQYDSESDNVGYPIPASPSIEGGSDRHLLMIDTNACVLYELFAAAQGSGGWTAGSGAVWSLGSNNLRTAGWTSADAAGLPIFPGLVRYSEVAAGVIAHAIRFTAPQTCEGYVYPARHQAGAGPCDVLPPMGLRVRLKGSVDISGFGPQSQVILTALKQYGMLLADNGSPWYITGAPDGSWDDDELHRLGQLSGSDFEVVDTAGFVNG